MLIVDKRLNCIISDSLGVYEFSDSPWLSSRDEKELFGRDISQYLITLNSHKFIGEVLKIKWPNEEKYDIKTKKEITDIINSTNKWWSDKEKYDIKFDEEIPCIAFSRVQNAWVGFSQRAFMIFKMGDRLFDETYEPKKEDYEEVQWKAWNQKYNEEIKKSLDDGDRVWVEIKKNGICGFIPFNFRGIKNIETLEESKQAAINFSDYVS